MIEIKKIYKKDIPTLLDNAAFWKHSFLSISKHRLYAHFKNPNSDQEDIVLLLAYLDAELVGYMGVYIDKIILDAVESKIGWLSTWWVHPKTQGTGIGRAILETMYAVNKGKIGISQFTPSAKRVYDKSGYFNTLKENEGIKAVLRSNLSFVLPVLFKKSKALLPLFKFLDRSINFFVNIKLHIQKFTIQRNLKNIKLEYLSTIDPETAAIITHFGKNHISPKSAAFFEWLKAYHWVQEAPLLNLTQKSSYEFSMVDHQFNIYLIKIIEHDCCIGFVVLQKRNYVCKIIFAYYDAEKHSKCIAGIIILQCIAQNVREIICYDQNIGQEFRKSPVFLYKTKKIKQSIISKEFKKENFENSIVNFGDGDCSFA